MTLDYTTLDYTTLDYTTPMTFVELIVNRPIRRSFRRADATPVVDTLADDSFDDGLIAEASNLTTDLDGFQFDGYMIMKRVKIGG